MQEVKEEHHSSTTLLALAIDEIRRIQYWFTFFRVKNFFHLFFPLTIFLFESQQIYNTENDSFVIFLNSEVGFCCFSDINEFDIKGVQHWRKIYDFWLLTGKLNLYIDIMWNWHLTFFFLSWKILPYHSNKIFTNFKCFLSTYEIAI